MNHLLHRLLIAGSTATLFLAAAGNLAAQGPAGGGQAGNTMPFANIYKRPTLSPYTALGFQGSNPQTGSTLGALQGLVSQQKQMQVQMQQGVQQSRQINQLQRQVRDFKRPATTQGNETIRPTGHASTYLNLSHFYPGR